MSETKLKHPLSVEGYNGSLEDLAKAVRKMRYDQFAEFLGYLAAYIKSEGDQDAADGKTKLPIRLYAASEHLYDAQEEIDSAWKICKPYMEDKE